MRRNFRLAFISILAAAAAALHAVEAFLPAPQLLPGAKLGLANILTLVAVAVYGVGDGVAVAFTRCLLGSLVAGNFLSLGFFLSLSGALASAGVMGTLLRRSGRRLSMIGVSVLGAVSHNLAQLVVVMLVVRHPGVLVYLPYLLLFALPAGCVTGVAARVAVRSLARSAACSDAKEAITWRTGAAPFSPPR